MRSYVVAAAAVLREHALTTPGAVTLEPFLSWGPEAGSAWGSSSKTVFVRRAQNITWSGVVSQGLSVLPERAALLRELSQNAGTRDQMNVLVGTRMGAATTQPEVILFEAIRAVLRPNTELVFDEAAFARHCDRLEHGFFDHERTATLLIPLRGVVFGGPPIEFGDRLVLDRLTDDEIVRCLELGILEVPAHGPLGGFFAPLPDLWGLRSQWAEPKRIGALDPDALGGLHPVQSAAEMAERAISALRLLQGGSFSPIAQLQFVEFSGGAGWSLYPQGPRYRQPYLLSGDRAEEVRALWIDLGAIAGVDSGALQNALRRFAFAAERHRHEDSLVDLMIAAESLFLNDLDRREGELKFRMSLRAGWLLGQDQGSRLGVYRQFRRAYDVRSDVVHGNPLDGKRSARASGGLDMQAFVDQVEDLLRQALRRTIEVTARTGKAWTSLDWDELLAGPDSPGTL
jgi:Apea-like HEPN